MDEKSLKTSVGQRIVIIVVALLLLGSTILTYMLIVLSQNNSSNTANSAKLAELQAQYTAKAAEFEEAAKPVGEKYFSQLKQYADKQVKSYNSTAANNEKLKTTDLKAGTGRELTEGDKNYLAYYVGWCPDGSILDSSFTYADDDTDKLTPTGLKAPLDASSMIEGWNQGVIGMKINGVRQINMSGDLAYGETTEGKHKCGMSNAPLRFIVLPIDDETLMKINSELLDISTQIYLAYIGSSK